MCSKSTQKLSFLILQISTRTDNFKVIYASLFYFIHLTTILAIVYRKRKVKVEEVHKRGSYEVKNV